MTAIPITNVAQGEAVFLDTGGKLPVLDGSQLSGVIAASAAMPTGNILWVDKVNGNDGTAVRGRLDKPYLTISAAITAASSGDTVVVMPGSYNELLVMAANVSVIGLDRQRCIITRASAVSETVVTMAASMVFEKFTLNLSPSANTTTALLFGGTSNATAQAVGITVNGTPSGTGVVNPLSITGTGAAGVTFFNLLGCSLLGAGTGSIGLAASSSGTTNIKDTSISATATGITTSGTCTLRLSNVRGAGTTGLSVGAGTTVTTDVTSAFTTITVASTGALSQDLVNFPRNNVTGAAPTTGNDITQGYAKGSIWIDTTSPGTGYICVDNTAAAAIWEVASATDTGGYFRANLTTPNPNDPTVYCYDTVANYPNTGSPQTTNQVQYTRVWLSKGRVLTKMRTYITSGANGTRQIELGIYDQATPTSITGVPNNRVASTAANTPPNATTGVYDVSLSSPYTVANSGFYWLAIQADNGAMAFAISATYRAAWNNSGRREESPGSFALPNPANATTTPSSAVLFNAAVE